ncbi:trigger factor [Candidatus Magnetaquicoccus inordinatus]|uniref:trigger factor n=1 Tax=Candidatus Magnetaquicoccus inordinatus TaxID=2496818 RepID=UPI00102C210E|nr:trigger factor [Candidatus Magnetaquicoccus inordinatus]
MDVIVKETATFDREVTVRIAASRVDELLEQELAKLATSAKLPGFRPGKIPKALLESRFRDHLSGLLVERLIQETYFTVLTEKELHPVDNEPRLTIGKIERGNDFIYTAQIQIYPEVDPKGYNGLTLTRRLAEVTDEDINTVIAQLRKEHARYETEEGRAAQMGDRVILDFLGKIDGEPFPGGQGTGHTLELGSGRFIDTFEEQLVGSVAGTERQVRVRFPDQYRASELAGKEATFDCTVHEVQASILPPEDDSLATLAGLREGGLTELRNEISNSLHKQAEQESEKQLKDAILRQLLASNGMELPERLVQRECRVIAKQAQRDYEQQGMSLADLGMSEEALAAQFVKPAQERVILGLVLGEIAEREKLVLDEAAVEARLEEMSAMFGERAKAMKQWFRENEERMESVRASILEQQTIDWIREQSTITEEKCTFKELMGQENTEAAAA